MKKELARFSKNSEEEIVVHLTQFTEHDLLDVRVWVKAPHGEGIEELRPIKKGIGVNVELILDLIEALERASQAAGV
jgi:hypothetical protein